MARKYIRKKPFVYTQSRQKGFKKATKVREIMFDLGRDAYYRKYGKN